MSLSHVHNIWDSGTPLVVPRKGDTGEGVGRPTSAEWPSAAASHTDGAGRPQPLHVQRARAWARESVGSVKEGEGAGGDQSRGSSGTRYLEESSYARSKLTLDGGIGPIKPFNFILKVLVNIIPFVFTQSCHFVLSVATRLSSDPCTASKRAAHRPKQVQGHLEQGCPCR